jgi:hypothetical protein
VATSNRPPKDLYQGGINRSYFLPFVAALEARCAEHALGAPASVRGSASSASTRGDSATVSSSSSSNINNNKRGIAVGSVPPTAPSSRDYRQLAAAAPMPSAYAWPLKCSGTSGDAGDSGMARFTTLLNLLCGSNSATGASAPAPLEVPVVMGRRLKVPLGSLAAKRAPFPTTTSKAATLAPPTTRSQEG